MSHRFIMTQLLTVLFPLDIWGDFINGVKLALANLIGSIFEFGMVAFVFVILIACIVYFTGYNKKALPWLVNGIVMEIVLSCFYMVIMGTTGPPDISIFFRSGA